ncbi:WD40 repeat domain-containing protein [Kutzneria buriramensis]|uniref:Novel STAND NTPase 1 domain-containing protein n=1 Tax=Kutzneria buriramensis TaxID=1045776 RepID=A0A3E0GZD9_9PSEU|nr:XRE family transcriptional regulator [Kutzneria buriramensis]REH35217.1 hypothetical protein BCF44_11877 [Kutzneria buriramensis]
MPRGERPLDNGPLREFAAGLRELRIGAGNPTYRELSERAHYSPSVLSDAAGGRKLPTLAVTLAYVTACGGDAAEWEARWRSLTAPAPAGGGPCPYVGLSTFQAGDAGLFFGRERLILQVLGQLRERRFVGVFGASGAGKSSMLRAGVAASDECSALVVVPGARPFDDVAARLAASADELAQDPSNLARVVHDHGYDLLVVDQFEEVFTLCGEADRAAFIAALMDPTLRVVIGVRADFYGHCGRYPELVAALDGAQVLVGPMSADELRRAIIRPAGVAGCVVEEALVTRLVADVGNQGGALPLLSHVLRETWRRRQGISLTLTGYEKTGGLQHALAQSAEQTFTALTPAQQLRARQLFLRLVSLGDVTHDTRRRVPTAEVGDDPDLPLAELTAARLITHDRHGAEITHEALIRHWPRLAGWLADDRDGLRVHRRLTEAADVWESLDQDDEALYVGNRLARAQEWADDHDSALSARERDFLRASRSLERSAATVARRRTRRLRILAVALAALFVFAAGTAAVAVNAESAQQATEKQRQEAVLDSVYNLIPTIDQQPLAVQLADSFELLHAPRDPALLNQVLTRRTPSVGIGQGGKAAFADDTKLLVTVTADGKATSWDLTRADWPVPVAGLTAPAGPSAVALSPRGDRLAVSYPDGTIRVWTLSAQRRPVADGTLHGPQAARLAFDPDGRRLAAGDAAGTTRVYDVTDPANPIESPGPVPGWALTAQSSPAELRGSMPGAISGDGARVVAAGVGDNMEVWDVRDQPTLVFTAFGGQHGAPEAISHDGRLVAAVTVEGRVLVYDTTRQTDFMLMMVSDAQNVGALAFASNGDLIASAANGLYRWHTDSAVAHADACTYGQMTPETWKQYFPGFDYRSPC